jgi:thioredoxin 1
MSRHGKEKVASPPESRHGKEKAPTPRESPRYSEALEMSLGEFKIRRKASDGVVVFFTAKWCGPCKTMYAIFDDMKKQSPDNMDMFKIDVDKSEEVNNYCEISSMPTFRFYCQGKLLSTFSGANEKQLIEQYNALIDALPDC